ncbi:MAG: nucleoside triphosphate pyrophosphohydrolase [Minisyncoccia bacterium]
MEPYNKLVRDKIPEILDSKGILYEKRIANDEEYRVELVKKLVEETNEFVKETNIEELADVVEVIEAMRLLPEFSEVESVRLKKKEERGGFEKRLILKGQKQ